jgi:hypothetical protein
MPWDVVWLTGRCEIYKSMAQSGSWLLIYGQGVGD